MLTLLKARTFVILSLCSVALLLRRMSMHQNCHRMLMLDKRKKSNSIKWSSLHGIQCHGFPMPKSRGAPVPRVIEASFE